MPVMIFILLCAQCITFFNPVLPKQKTGESIKTLRKFWKKRGLFWLQIFNLVEKMPIEKSAYYDKYENFRFIYKMRFILLNAVRRAVVDSLNVSLSKYKRVKKKSSWAVAFSR